MNIPGWFSNVSNSSLATTILSLSALSMTKMIAWPSLRKKKKAEEMNEWRKIASRAAALGQLPVIVLPKVSVSALSRHVKHCEGKTTSIGGKTDMSEVKIITEHISLTIRVKWRKLSFCNALTKNPTWRSWTSLCWSQWSAQCLVPGPKR